MSENSVTMICQDVMAIDHNILGVAVIDKNGRLLSSFSNDSMEGTFEINVSEKHYGLWTKVILRLIEETGQCFGPVKAIVTLHKNCILELIPVKSREMLIGLILSRSTNTDYVTSKILDLLEGNATDLSGYDIYTP